MTSLIRKFFKVLVWTLLVSACSYYPYLTDTERNTVLENVFSEELRKGYLELADSELAKGDTDDAGNYRYKVQSIVAERPIDPETLSIRKIPTDKLNELSLARNFLMTAFAKNIVETDPVLAARAQISFDCWVEEQEENFQHEEIRQCRDAFKAAEERIVNIIGQEKEEGPEIVDLDEIEEEKEIEAKMPKPYVVFFDFDSFVLGEPAKEVLKRVAEEVPYFKPSRIILVGHADRVGTEEYNHRLSEKRAYEVAGELASEGVSADLLIIRALGEKQPRVETKDGIREPRNRFVEIIFEK